eukprot:3653015-Prymnesium_polylepis.1
MMKDGAEVVAVNDPFCDVKYVRRRPTRAATLHQPRAHASRATRRPQHPPPRSLAHAVPTACAQAAYLFKYDSTHGMYKGTVSYDEAS